MNKISIDFLKVNWIINKRYWCHLLFGLGIKTAEYIFVSCWYYISSIYESFFIYIYSNYFIYHLFCFLCKICNIIKVLYVYSANKLILGTKLESDFHFQIWPDWLESNQIYLKIRAIYIILLFSAAIIYLILSLNLYY